jgi:hypothetical protein
MNDIGSVLDDFVVDCRGRCKLALAANLSLTQGIHADNVGDVTMEWLLFCQLSTSTYHSQTEAVLTIATLEAGP